MTSVDNTSVADNEVRKATTCAPYLGAAGASRSAQGGEPEPAVGLLYPMHYEWQLLSEFALTKLHQAVE